MNTSSNVRVSAFSPLSLGIFVAGILMFVVIAIVRNVTTQPSDIGTTTAASLTAIPWDHIPRSNNVAGALPAFQAPVNAEPFVVIKAPEATVVGVYDNVATGVTLVEPMPVSVAPRIDLSWATQEWLAIATTADGSRWVFGGAWFSCQHIDKGNLFYLANPTDQALAKWNELAPRKQSDLARECGQ